MQPNPYAALQKFLSVMLNICNTSFEGCRTRVDFTVMSNLHGKNVMYMMRHCYRDRKWEQLPKTTCCVRIFKSYFHLNLCVHKYVSVIYWTSCYCAKNIESEVVNMLIVNLLRRVSIQNTIKRLSQFDLLRNDSPSNWGSNNVNQSPHIWGTFFIMYPSPSPWQKSVTSSNIAILCFWNLLQSGILDNLCGSQLFSKIINQRITYDVRDVSLIELSGFIRFGLLLYRQ